MKPNIGFSLQGNYTAPMEDVLPLLRDVGFDAVSPVWQQDGSHEAVLRTAQACGLILQSLHGPFRGITGMWEQAAPAILPELLQSVDACAGYGIPVLVVHVWGGYHYSFREETLCFDHFDVLVEYAQRKGIRIAFENLEGPEYLNVLMARYKDDHTVGFCWDCGHEFCYTPQSDMLAAYGDRLLMTHLNDNFGITRADGQIQGTDDLHLLPYDGHLNWTCCMDRLKQAKSQQILNFEFKIRPKGDRCTTDLYSKMPLTQYFEKAYDRARRVSAGYFE